MKILNLTKSYGENAVLKGLSLNVEKGKITCVLGESGCGKTTLLNAVARLIPFGGEIAREGAEEEAPAYIFQEPRLLPNLTVEKNLALINKDKEKISSALKKARLVGKEKFYPSALSGGERQRAAIARALLYNSGFFLMDEPFSSLDIKLKSSLVKEFFSLWNEENFTALFVTHSVEEAAALSHKVAVLSNGKICAELSSSPDGDIFSSAPIKIALRDELLK